MMAVRARTRCSGDGGFTLPELLMTIGIMAIVVPVVAMAFILALRVIDDADDRFGEAADSELLLSYFLPDAQSSTVIGTADLDTPCDSLENPDDILRLVSMHFATGYRRVDLTPSDGQNEYVIERWNASLTDTNGDGVAECGTDTRRHVVADHVRSVTTFSDTEKQVALTVTATSGTKYTVSASQRTGTINLNSRPRITSMTVNCHNLSCDATGSWHDPDGTIVTVEWNWGDGSPVGAVTEHDYLPPGGTFTVTLTVTDDAGAQATATQEVTVEPNIPPVAVADSYTTNEDTRLDIAAPGVLANDTDNDPLIAQVDTAPAHGTLNLSPNGAFTYDPAPDYNGADSFTYTAMDIDGEASPPVTVTITILPANDPPIAANDQYATDEDVPLDVAAPGVLANDEDVEGDAVTADLVSGPAHGTVTLDPDGSFRYEPAANYKGTDAFTYRAHDGQEFSNTVTVSLTVNSVNDAPPTAGDDAFTTAEDSLRSVAAPGVLGNDSDVDGDPMTAVLVTDVAHGDLVLNANGSFTYMPHPNYNGPDSFTYAANDGIASGNTATVTIDVTPVNDAPDGVPESYSVYEDEVLTDPVPGVLGNDDDVEGEPLTASLVATTSHGSLSLNTNGSFTYTPVPNYFGPDSFTYRANDPTSSSAPVVVTITVVPNPVNDAPTANGNTYSTNEDTVLPVIAPGVLGNDTDPDLPGDTLTAVLVSGPAHGTLDLHADGSFTYTPTANYNGPDSFTYRAEDAAGAQSNVATVAITVTGVNDAPVGNPDSYTMGEDGGTLLISAPGVLANDSDIETPGSLTVGTASGPSHAQSFTLDADGSFSYRPATNFNGSDSFTYLVSDGSLTDDVTVTITVTPVNDPPTASFSVGYCTTAVDPCVWNLSVNASASSDVDGTIVSYAWSWGDGSPASSGVNPNHTYTVPGSQAITLTVTDDDGATAIATANATPPVLTFTTRTSCGWFSCTYYVDLSWSGIPGDDVEIYRNGGSPIDSNDPNDGAFTRSSGSQSNVLGTYWVCERGGGHRCTNSVTVTSGDF